MLLNGASSWGFVFRNGFCNSFWYSYGKRQISTCQKQLKEVRLDKSEDEYDAKVAKDAYNEYINEVKKLNHLGEDTIHSGQHIVIPYYSAVISSAVIE